MTSYDEVYCILQHVNDLKTLGSCLFVNKCWSHQAKDRLLATPFCRLLNEDKCVQSDLLECLFITPRIAENYDYSCKRRYGGGFYKIFDLPQTIFRILDDHGGISGIKKRQRLREQRSTSAKESRVRICKLP